MKNNIEKIIYNDTFQFSIAFFSVLDNWINHKWVLVYIQGSWYEFESTCFNFQKSSDKYSNMFTQIFNESCIDQ